MVHPGQGWGRLRWLVAAAIAVALAVHGLRWSVVEINGTSMMPLFRPGDRLVTVPAIRRLLVPGAIVIVENPHTAGHLVVKRLVRITGDRAVVVGDAADHSTDSRTWGPIATSAIRRVALCRWPYIRSLLIGAATDVPLADHAWEAIRTRRR
ncbi:MAG: S26 family signal peptidase [Nitriliruptoraceae bacterium]